MARVSKSKPEPNRAFSAKMWHENLLVTILFLALIAVPNAPRLNAVFIFLIGVSTCFCILKMKKEYQAGDSDTPLSWPAMTFGGLCIYLFINSTWAEEIDVALGKAVFVTAIGVILVLRHTSISRLPDSTKQKVGRYILWGAAIGFAIACFEFSTGHLIQWLIFKTWPAIRPDGNSIRVLVEQGGVSVPLPTGQYQIQRPNEIVIIRTDGLNRHLSSLLLVYWPVVLIALNTEGLHRRWFVTGFIALTGAGAVFAGQSQTALLALLLGTATLVSAFIFPVFTYRTIVVSWCIALVFALPLAAAPYKANWHKADWLFNSARDRVAIWGYTVERTMKAPIFGVGIRSTRFIGRKLKDEYKKDPELVAPERLGLHAHNNYLQVWYELGAVGAALILAFGLALLSSIQKMSREIKPYALATFATACIIAAFGWGLWQSWLLSGYGFAIILMTVANALPKRKNAAIPNP